MNDGPQVENGYTKIANELMEALSKSDFTNREFRCVMFLIRKTYGWERKADTVSLTQWEEGTGLKRGHLVKTLNRLVERKVIIRTEDDGIGRGKTITYAFNKHYKNWCSVPTGVPPELPFGTHGGTTEKGTHGGTRKGTHGGTETSTHGGTHKRKKETIKERERTPVGDYIRYYLDNVTETRQQFPTGIEQNTIRRLAQTATLEEWKAACDKTGRQRRGDPLAYIEAVLDGKRAEAAPATVDFDWGAMTE